MARHCVFQQQANSLISQPTVEAGIEPAGELDHRIGSTAGRVMARGASTEQSSTGSVLSQTHAVKVKAINGAVSQV